MWFSGADDLARLCDGPFDGICAAASELHFGAASLRHARRLGGPAPTDPAAQFTQASSSSLNFLHDIFVTMARRAVILNDDRKNPVNPFRPDFLLFYQVSSCFWAAVSFFWCCF